MVTSTTHSTVPYNEVWALILILSSWDLDMHVRTYMDRRLAKSKAMQPELEELAVPQNWLKTLKGNHN